MPKSVCKHFKLDAKKFDATGAFDALLDWDTKLFVDPFLLKGATTPEFHGAYDELLRYFSEIIKLVTVSAGPSDLTWRTARKRLVFRETPGFGLGYAKENTSGSGMGDAFAEKLLTSIGEIARKGIQDPELFELLGLFEEGVGCDRISDMTCSILLERFFNYSSRVFAESGYKGQSLQWRQRTYTIPRHPFQKNAAVLLAPKELLRDLPVAEDALDLGYIFESNEVLRQKLNKVLGNQWRADVREFGKTKLKDWLIGHPEFLREIVDTYKKATPIRYDFRRDPSGEVVWRQYADQVTTQFPLALILNANAGPADVIEIVRKICDTFRQHVENNGLWEALYDGSGKPRRERISQRLFFSVADSYCEANNLDLSRESDAGRGPVDFKLSRGSRGKVVVELKLSTNKKLLHGYTEQVELYKSSEKADHAIYLVLQVSDKEKPIQKLLELKNKLSSTGPVPEIIIVDAQPKKSASKA